MKTLKQNKRCSSIRNSYLLKREKRPESHLLFEQENHLLQVVLSLSLSLSLTKKTDDITPIMNCYPRNGY